VHFDQAIARYDPVEHRPLATRFGQDVRIVILSFRSWGLWSLGYVEAALADADHVVKDAREIRHATAIMYALTCAMFTHTRCGNYATASAQADEVAKLAT
jgi:hypothetical protein